MIRFRTDASLHLLGAFVLLPLAAPVASAGEFGPDHPVVAIPSTPIADRCSQYGQGFVDVGNGVCGRVSRRVRVYVGGANGTITAPGNPYAVGNPYRADGTANAAIRSDNMVPGANVTHLRVRGGLDGYNPFR